MISVRKNSGEVIHIDTEEILDAADFAALIGREDDPVVQALISEIRRLGTVLAEKSPAPVVNVSPAAVTVSPPSVSVSPVFHTPVKSWTLEVTSRDPQGKIRTMQFTPQSA
jgi:hypothetical protein